MNIAKPLYIYLFCLLGSFSFMGCEEADVLDQALAFKSRVVVNSIFSPDTPWELRIHTTRNILDPNSKIQAIRGANVTVLDLDTDEEITLNYILPGYYLNENVFPIEGHRYRVIVDAPGYEYISAESVVPHKVKINTHSLTRVDTENGVFYEIMLDIEDDPSVDEYYGWEVYKLESTTVLTESDPQQIPIASNDNSNVLPSDDDRIYTANVNAFNIRINAADIDYKDEIETFVQIKTFTISEDYYKFSESQKFAQTNTSISQTPFHTNIEGGLGIFGGFVEHQIQIKIE